MPPNKMERFTVRAREVLSLAQEEAESFQDAYIGTEHILLGLVREESGVAARAMRDLGVEQTQLVAVVYELTRAVHRAHSQMLGLSPNAKRLLEQSVNEAHQLGHRYIGTEHLLLALVYPSDDIAVDILKRLGISADRIRQHVLRVLEESPARENESSDESEPKQDTNPSERTAGDALQRFGIDPDEVRRQVRRMLMDIPQRDTPAAEAMTGASHSTQPTSKHPQSLVRKAELDSFEIIQSAIAGILKLVAEGKLTSAQAAELFAAMQPHLTLSTGHTAQLVAKALGSTNLEKRQLQVIIRDSTTNDVTFEGLITLQDAMNNLDTIVDAIIQNDTSWFWAEDVDTNRRIEFRIVEGKP